jgi:hypothetical protein
MWTGGKTMTQDSGYSPLTPPASTGAAGTGPAPTAQVARDQAGQVASSTQEAGAHVAHTAVDQAREVASEARRQARDLLGEVRSQAADQASQQQKRAVEALRALATELRQMADRSGQGGVASELAWNASDRLHGVAGWIDQREPGTLVDEVRSFARRRPGAFLMGAALAGAVAGRLTRGIAAQRQHEQGVDSYRYGSDRLDYGDARYRPTGSDRGYGTAGHGTTGTAGYGTAGTDAGYGTTGTAGYGTAGTEAGYGTSGTAGGYGTAGTAGTEAGYGTTGTATGQVEETGVPYRTAAGEDEYGSAGYGPAATTDPRRPGTELP